MKTIVLMTAMFLTVAFAGPLAIAGWSSGPNLPSNVARATGAYFPANGRFYSMGGRSDDEPGNSFTHPFEYNPVTNTWITKAATYPDNRVGGMVCAVLTAGGTPQIYCVGGNEFFGDTTTARVFSYNPVTDTITTLTAADNWPGNTTGTILPGGFAVAGNKLYIIGGFDFSIPAGTAETWQFDPNAAVGSRWLQRLDYPVERGYVPAAAIGGLIYTAGGLADFTDSADSFKYDPVANTWTAITNIPTVTGETRGVVINNEMWVLGGGISNPSNEVDIYNPCSNTWRLGPPFATGRRFFPTDTNGSRIWLAGGFDPSGSPVNTMEIFTVPAAQSAVSRKTHGAATFDVPLPLTGSLGIECRSTAGNHTMLVTFANPVTLSGASVTCGVGSVGSFSASGAVVTVNLTGVANAQRITVTLANVNDGTTIGDVGVPMGVLAGDTGGNGTVNASDIGETKGQLGQPLTAANFRSDVNANGAINASDLSIVKSNSGTGLP